MQYFNECRLKVCILIIILLRSYLFEYFFVLGARILIGEVWFPSAVEDGFSLHGAKPFFGLGF